MIKQIPNHKRDFKEKSTKYCVVVPVINRRREYKLNFKKWKYLQKDIDIIIADGGSTDGSLELDFKKL